MQLTEAFKSNYETFMSKHIIDECYIASKEIEVEQAKLVRALDVAISTARLLESVELTEDNNIDLILKQVQNMGANLSRSQADNMMSSIHKQALGIRDLSGKEINDLSKAEYEPISVKKRTDLSDVQGPVNKLKFLLDRIIDWIKRVVVFAINKVKGIFYMVVGRKDDASKMLEKTSVADLKLRMSKLEKLDTGFIRSITKGGNVRDPKPVQVIEIQPDVAIQNGAIFKPLTESYLYEFGGGAGVTPPPGKDNDEENPDKNNNKSGRNNNNNNKDDYKNKRTPLRAVELDTSTDLYALQQTLHHFFELFDSSFGSNGENLFDTSDLVLVFKYIDSISEQLSKGELNPVLMQSRMENISSDVVYDNLLRTRTNCDNLNKAYYETYVQIDKINKIITSKQLLSLNQFGVNYIFLSQYTYSAMIDVLKYVDQRLAEAGRLQKELDLAKNKYEELCNKVSRLRNGVKGYGYISTASIYDEKINDLYLSTKYMTQIVSMRLNTLLKYIQELQAVRLTIANLNAIGTAQRSNMGVSISTAF